MKNFLLFGFCCHGFFLTDAMMFSRAILGRFVGNVTWKKLSRKRFLEKQNSFSEKQAVKYSDTLCFYNNCRVNAKTWETCEGYDLAS